MDPLRITATLDGGISLPGGPLALDGLLAWAEAQRRGLPPPGFGPLADVEIPIAKSSCARFYLASFSLVSGWDAHERRFVNRKFPLHEAQMMAGPKLTRIKISAGAQKSYRLPHEVAFAENDELTWFAIGDAEGVRDLLACVTHLGKRRAVGRGRVRAWGVSACDSWGDGFPVARDGKPLRSLPLDWPGLVEPALARRVLSPPYWEHVREQVCAVPS